MSRDVRDLGPVLAGCRILVTAQRRADELAAALVRRGAVVVVAPALGVVPHVDEVALLESTRKIIADPVDVLVVTTGVGLRGWLETAETAGLADDLVETLSGTRLIARGPKAKGALQAAGLRADWVAESETAAEIADFLLGEGVEHQRIAVQRHGAGDDGLDARLSAGGASVTSLEIYRWGPPPDPELLREATEDLADGGYDAVLFTSAPGASAWLTELRRLEKLDSVRSLVSAGRLSVAAVGPVTAEPLRVAGLEVSVPDRWRLGALVRLVIAELGGRAGVPTPGGLLKVRARAATLDHEVLSLTPSGFAVLSRLARAPGEVVSHEELLHVLPGDSADPHVADLEVGRLRDAIGSPDAVRSMGDRGYALDPAGSP
ncbi:MAG: uroporphyrinogen-III synthase [Marmoricola sp.]